MTVTTSSNPNHEDTTAFRHIQKISARYGACQLVCGVLNLTCSIVAISQFDSEIVPVVNYGVNICSGLMVCYNSNMLVINSISHTCSFLNFKTSLCHFFCPIAMIEYIICDK